MESTIKEILLTSSKMKAAIAADAKLVSQIETAAQAMLKTVRAGGTIYACGNGGSACDAMHLVEELVARYKRERIGIRAMHFMDSSTMTCWSNDYEFAAVYERQAETFCTDRDTLVAISTSGNSDNILRAVKAAKVRSTFCIGLTGKDGGKLASACDISLIVPAKETERIQEAHITIIHIFCELVEVALLKK